MCCHAAEHPRHHPGEREPHRSQARRRLPLSPQRGQCRWAEHDGRCQYVHHHRDHAAGGDGREPGARHRHGSAFLGHDQPRKRPGRSGALRRDLAFRMHAEMPRWRRQSPDRSGDSSRQLRTRRRRRRHPRTEHRISGQARRIQCRRNRHRRPGLRLDPRAARGRPDPGRKRHRRCGNAWREDQPAQLTRVLPVRMGSRGAALRKRRSACPRATGPRRQRLPLRRCPSHRPSPGNHLPLPGHRHQYPARSADDRGGQDVHDPCRRRRPRWPAKT